MDAKGTIAIVDGDTIWQDGLHSTLTRLGHHVALLADHADHYITATRACPVNLVVVNVGNTTDGSLPPVEGLAVIAYIREHQPDVQVLALFQTPDVDFPNRAFRAGAACVEDFDHLRPDTLGRIVATLLQGQRYRNPYLDQRIHGPPRAEAKPLRTGKELLDRLTKTQRKVLDLSLHPVWLTNERIGLRLHISRHTVKTHLRMICRKLGCATRKDLLPLGARHGWLHHKP